MSNMGAPVDKTDKTLLKQLRASGVRKKAAKRATGDPAEMTKLARDLRNAATALDDRAGEREASGGHSKVGPPLPGQEGAVRTKARSN